LRNSNITTTFNGLISLIQKLPIPFKTSVLKELNPIRAIYIERRAPRICILGASTRSAVELIFGLGTGELTEEQSRLGWTNFKNANSARISIFDARGNNQEAPMGLPLSEPAPDLVLVFPDESNFTDISITSPLPNLPGVPVFKLSAGTIALSPIHPPLSEINPPLPSHSASSIQHNEWQALLCASLPLEAQLEFARLLSAKRAQAYIASTLLKSFGAVSGAVGMQPIPVADMPLLFSIQATMVALIIHTSGRPASLKLASEFLAALGVSAGAGFLFRETARALLRFIPIWGNAVSGIIAGTGTYAIGRAAIAYFIDDSPLVETRRLFLSLMKTQKKPILNN